MRLDYLIKDLDASVLRGRKDIEIKGITSDSRQVEKDYLFVAVRGKALDGHRYAHQAIKNGASAIAVENMEEDLEEGVTIVRLQSTRMALSGLGASFYQYPWAGLNLIGLTGTNGKTTTSYLLESILKEDGRRVGVIGSISYRYLEKSVDAGLTTPEPLELMRIIREMKDSGVTDLIIEVSSHSLDQERTSELDWSVVVFTNFSRDHLDYHHNMEDYFQAKSMLFRSRKNVKEKEKTRAVINMDDPKGKLISENTGYPVTGYGLGPDCSISARDIQCTREGLRFTMIAPAGNIPVQSSLLGGINVYNMLGAAAAAFELGTGPEAVSRGIKGLSYVPGRLQSVKNKRGLFLFIDYAHTPDSLERVLQTLLPLRLEKGKLITVFGCGGDRDKGKRPEMGEIAARYTDIVIITSDNPRGEDPAAIAGSIESGVKRQGMTRTRTGDTLGKNSYDIILDRRGAIRTAIAMATDRDIVLIAGKGHEDYQITGNEKRHFNDLEEAAMAADGDQESAARARQEI